jgi:hypothetical protein
MKKSNRTAGLVATWAGLGVVLAALSGKIAQILRIPQVGLLLGVGMGFLILLVVLTKSKRTDGQATAAGRR